MINMLAVDWLMTSACKTHVSTCNYVMSWRF